MKADTRAVTNGKPHPHYCACTVCVELFDQAFAEEFPEEAQAERLRADSYAARKAEREGRG